MTLERMVQRNEKWLEQNVALYERKIIRIYKDVVKEIRNELGAVYEKYAIGGKLTFAEMSKYNRLTKLEKEINVIAGHGTQLVRGSIKRLTAEQYQEAFYRNAWAFDNDIGVRASWTIFRPGAVQAAVSNRIAEISKQRLKEITRTRIQSTVASGLIRGDSFDKMAREMRKGLSVSASDALRIARTEGGRAQTLGTLASYQEAEDMGIDLNVEWRATLDIVTRESHGNMDGVRKEEQGFPFPGLGYVEGPRLTGVAAHDCNCRCTIVPIITDVGQRLRRDRERGVVPFQTYNQWKKEATNA